MVTQLVAVDLGGTHARFAIATIGAGGAITLSAPVTLRDVWNRASTIEIDRTSPFVDFVGTVRTSLHSGRARFTASRFCRAL